MSFWEVRFCSIKQTLAMRACLAQSCKRVYACNINSNY